MIYRNRFLIGAVVCYGTIAALMLTTFGIGLAAAWLQSDRLGGVSAVMVAGSIVLGFACAIAADFSLDAHRRRRDWRDKETDRLRRDRDRAIEAAEHELGIRGDRS